MALPNSNLKLSDFKKNFGLISPVKFSDFNQINDVSNNISFNSFKNFIYSKKYTFEAGSGGNGGSYSYVRGGGGAGGVVVKFNNEIINPTINATAGGSANGGNGGTGGLGFGAGGGGGGHWWGMYRLLGGRGANGMVYIWTLVDEFFITTTQTITLPRNTTFLGIFGIGGGGGGGTGRTNNCHAGAGSGYFNTHILQQNIPKNTTITITIGSGGLGNAPPTNGSFSRVVINLNPSITYTFNGGNNGSSNVNGGTGGVNGGARAFDINGGNGSVISISQLNVINKNTTTLINDYS